MDAEDVLLGHFGKRWADIPEGVKKIAIESFYVAASIYAPDVSSDELTVEDIITALDIGAKEMFGLSHSEVFQRSHLETIVEARDMYTVLFRELYPCTYAMGCSLLGYKMHHSSVITMERRVTDRLAYDRFYRKRFNDFKDKVLCILKEMK